MLRLDTTSLVWDFFIREIDSNYKCEKHTYASLCQELMYEYEIKTGEVAPSEEYIRYKTKNAKNNGIINKLNHQDV